ncbi:MAG TPA: carboxylesterase family protein [Aliidongia sp.]|nr:carboxylesterase family protein [Aliidongia sp.]
MVSNGQWSRRHLLGVGGAALALAGVGAPACAASGGVAIFRGIRYARAERFGQPEIVPFDESLIKETRGPIAPQAPSRLGLAMGPAAAVPQDEHCQVLSVFTPSRAGRRPVMVFLHGGAFVSGAGELPWYDGDKLAGEQDVVVVSVTYRLGALGYLQFAGGTAPSPGMSDQVAALEWVKANIAKFGGDPGNVTLFGQSAGGGSIVAMGAWGHGGTLFHRAIVQSGAIPPYARAQIEEVSAAYLKVLGKDPRTASAAEIVEAQGKFAAVRPETTVWLPVGPAAPVPLGVPLLCGWTREDNAPFVLIREKRQPTPGADLAPFREASRPRIEAAQKLAAETAAAGQKAHLYRFAWNGPDTGLGDCHTIELPFLLGSEAAWREAPMLAGAPWTEIDRLGRKMRAVWAAFARTGDPGAAGGTRWPLVTAAAQPVTDLPPG